MYSLVRRVDDQLVEAGVVGDDRGGVALDVGIGGGLQLLLQFLEHGVGQIPAGELRGQRVDLRQRPVAFSKSSTSRSATTVVRPGITQTSFWFCSSWSASRTGRAG